ncbi:hypothetical protein [Cellulomonas sp. P5_C6]
MTSRRWALLAVVGVSLLVVAPMSGFLWFIGLLMGSPFMASMPSHADVVEGGALRAIAVLVWAVPIAVAWQQLGVRAARKAAVVVGTVVAVSLAVCALTGLW